MSEPSVNTKGTATPQPVPRRLRKQVQAYIDRLKPLLGVQGWSINVGPTTTTISDADAEICMDEQMRAATIYVAAAFGDRTPHRKREIITHELVHLHHHDIYAVAETAQKVLSQEAWAILKENLRREIEAATYGVADVIAPHMPKWETK